MKKTFLSFALIVSFLINAQVAPDIEWQKSLGGSSGDYATSIQKTTDNGYIVVGYSASTNGDVSGNHGPSTYYDYWVVKLDNIGNIIWQKSLGGTDDDVANSVQQTSDGGYIIAGYSLSNDGDVSNNHGNADYWIVKLDNDGNIEWQKTFGGTRNEYAESIKQTNDGGYIIAGTSNSNDGDAIGNHGGVDVDSDYYDYWILKIDSDGNIKWQKMLGGTNRDKAYSIEQTSDNGYIVAGYAMSGNGDVSGHHGNINYDYWVVKLDINGNIQWQKALGGYNDDYGRSIQQTRDGGYIVAGYSYSNNGDVTGHHGSSYNYDYWIVKLNNIGNIEWQKSLGGTKDERAFSIFQTSDNGYVVAGSSLSSDGDITGHYGSTNVPDYWITKLNSSGNLQWQKSLGGTNNETAYSIQETNDDNYIIAGNSSSNSDDVSGNHGGWDYWIVKLKSSNLSINEVINKIEIYPNPVKNNINFTEQVSNIEILDTTGKTVKKVSALSKIIDVSNLLKGNYLVKLKTISGEVINHKFTKE